VALFFISNPAGLGKGIPRGLKTRLKTDIVIDTMKLVYKGKTKDVFELCDGNYLLQFKDDVTGADGVFDPGANHVGLTIAGAGSAGVRLTEFFFKKIEAAGIPTHFVSADAEKAQMVVRPAGKFGNGMEIICRLKATGSFLRRYGDYCKEGQPLDFFVEVTLKDDAREDPPITKDALEMLGILGGGEYETLKQLTRKITAVIMDELAEKGVELYDIKLEFGRIDGRITLVDEISGGNMRAYRNGEYIQPLDLPAVLLG